jgi:hypothetical protein
MGLRPRAVAGCLKVALRVQEMHTAALQSGAGERRGK